MIGGLVGVALNGSGYQLNGGFIVARLACDQSQQVIGVGMTGVRAENPAIGGFRLGQATGLMVLDALLNELLKLGDLMIGPL